MNLGPFYYGDCRDGLLLILFIQARVSMFCCDFDLELWTTVQFLSII